MSSEFHESREKIIRATDKELKAKGKLHLKNDITVIAYKDWRDHVDEVARLRRKTFDYCLVTKNGRLTPFDFEGLADVNKRLQQVEAAERIYGDLVHNLEPLGPTCIEDIRAEACQKSKADDPFEPTGWRDGEPEIRALVKNVKKWEAIIAEKRHLLTLIPFYNGV